MKPFLLKILFLIIVSNAFAQQERLVTAGSITFEKTTNVYGVLRKTDMASGTFEQYKNTNPQFFSEKSNLLFNVNQSLFSPEPSAAPSPMLNSILPLPFTRQINTVFTDFGKTNRVIQKDVFGDKFLYKDSLNHIRWKITDEFREIAGFTCRRANGLILDSVYVVAFYTDEIHIPGGPESFGGLPGMILEVALPHDNIIWKAIQVSELAIPDSKISPPQNGKAIDLKLLDQKINSSMKNVNQKNRVLIIKELSL